MSDEPPLALHGRLQPSERGLLAPSTGRRLSWRHDRHTCQRASDLPDLAGKEPRGVGTAQQVSSVLEILRAGGDYLPPGCQYGWHGSRGVLPLLIKTMPPEPKVPQEGGLKIDIDITQGGKGRHGSEAAEA
jgi:hypothetical protein